MTVPECINCKNKTSWICDCCNQNPELKEEEKILVGNHWEVIIE